MKRNIPDFLIEQLDLDELDPRIKAELMLEPAVVERLENLRTSNAEILETYPPAEMGRLIEARLKAVKEAQGERSDRKGTLSMRGRLGRRLRRSSADFRSMQAGRSAARRRGFVAVVQWKGFYPALAAAAVIALVLGVLPLATRGGLSPSSESGVHIKGVGPTLHVYRETPNGAEQLASGAQARAHDLLQLSYLAAGARFGMIFSIDGSGTVTLHFPQTGSTAAALESGGEIALPFSYELDNAPSFERFYFVTSNKLFSLNEILNIARNAARKNSLPSIDFPAGFQVAVFTINKETKR